MLGADETGIRVAGALAWVHAARTDTLTRYTVSSRRGVEAMLDAGVLPALARDTEHLGRELIAAADIPGQTG